MRSVPPAEFDREAAALSPSKSLSNRRTESIVQPVSRQIAVRHKTKRLILPARRVLPVAMTLSSRHRFDLAPDPDVAPPASSPSRVFFWPLRRDRRLASVVPENSEDRVTTDCADGTNFGCGTLSGYENLRQSAQKSR